MREQDQVRVCGRGRTAKLCILAACGYKQTSPCRVFRCCSSSQQTVSCCVCVLFCVQLKSSGCICCWRGPRTTEADIEPSATIAPGHGCFEALSSCRAINSHHSGRWGVSLSLVQQGSFCLGAHRTAPRARWEIPLRSVGCQEAAQGGKGQRRNEYAITEKSSTLTVDLPRSSQVVAQTGQHHHLQLFPTPTSQHAPWSPSCGQWPHQGRLQPGDQGCQEESHSRRDYAHPRPWPGCERKATVKIAGASTMLCSTC